MTSATFTHETLGASIYRDARNGNAWLWRSAQTMFALSILCLGLQWIDARTLHGASVWMKPAKFYFSIAVHLATLSWGLMLLPEAVRLSRKVTIASAVFVAASWIELCYITYRAGYGEASHFNVGTPIAAFMYSMMAFGAVTMTAVTGYFGVLLMRNRDSGLMVRACAIGFILSAILATVVGFYLGGQTSHWNGGDLTDATGTGFFGWSTTGGDLRVAHFVALHAAQFVPFAGFSGRRDVVYGAALIVLLLTALTFIQALSGMPLFRV